MHHALFAETHFVLGGVNVHIHHGRVQLQKQYIGRVAAVVEHIRIRLAHRMADHLVANHPAIHIKILQVRLGAGKRGQPHPAVQTQAIALHIHGYRLLHKALATQLGHPGRPQGVIQPGGQLMNHFLVMGETKRGIEFTQGDAPKHFFEMIEFGFFSAQEPASGRGIKKQVAHGHGGATGMTGRSHGGRHIAPFHGHLPAFRFAFHVTGQAQS